MVSSTVLPHLGQKDTEFTLIIQLLGIDYIKSSLPSTQKKKSYMQKAQNKNQGANMSNPSTDRRWLNEGVISAISIGLLFVLIGVIFALNQQLVSNFNDFFKDIRLQQVGNLGNSKFFLPAPATPANHTYVYAAASQFALGVGIIEILILTLRLSLSSRMRRTAQTAGDLVFWFGAAYLLNSLASMKTGLAIPQQRETWFLFWTAIIILIGFSLVIRALVLFATRHQKPTTTVIS